MIPLILLEEHHEAFLVWEAARQRGWMPLDNLQLLHVDAHSDMAWPTVRTSLHDLTDIASCRRFTYEELTVANFLLAAVCRGHFNRIHWVQKFSDDPAEGLLHVASHSRAGRNLFVTKDIRRAGVFSADRKHFAFRRLRCPLQERLAAPWCLDIDLDYFSTHDGPQWLKLEITPEEFHRYQEDRLHTLRMIAGAQAVVTESEGRYYFQYDYSDATGHGTGRESLSKIEQGIEQLMGELRQFPDPPQVITVCRSARSGYSPADQVDEIQVRTLNELQRLYKLEIVDCDGL